MPQRLKGVDQVQTSPYNQDLQLSKTASPIEAKKQANNLDSLASPIKKNNNKYFGVRRYCQIP